MFFTASSFFNLNTVSVKCSQIKQLFNKNYFYRQCSLVEMTARVAPDSSWPSCKCKDVCTGLSCTLLLSRERDTGITGRGASTADEDRVWSALPWSLGDGRSEVLHIIDAASWKLFHNLHLVGFILKFFTQTIIIQLK